MKGHCPTCGASCEADADVSSLVSVWMSCGRCGWVWKRSLLESALNFVTRTVVRRPAPRKVLDVLLSEKPAHRSLEPRLSDTEAAGSLDDLERALNAVTSRTAL